MLYVRHHDKSFIYIFSCHLHKDPVRWRVLSSCYRWENRGSDIQPGICLSSPGNGSTWVSFPERFPVSPRYFSPLYCSQGKKKASDGFEIPAEWHRGILILPFPPSVSGMEGRCGPRQGGEGGGKAETDLNFSQLNLLSLCSPMNSATCAFSGTIKLRLQSWTVERD